MNLGRNFLLVLVLFGFAAHANANCVLSAGKRERLLKLEYLKFDQNLLGGGWRGLAKRECYIEAGQLIDEYMKVNTATLTVSEKRVLTWHAGQMYGFQGNVPLARARFAASFNPEEPVDSPILWNDYVAATIAFLDSDMAALKLHREHIAQGPEFHAKKVNLNIVDNLIKHFGEPYKVAYNSN